MSVGENNKERGAALFRVASVFILDLIINAAWSIAVVIIFGIVFYYANGIPATSSEMLDQMTRSPEYLFFISAYNIFVIILVYLFWKHADKRSTEVIGLKWNKGSARMIGLGMLGGTIEIGLIMLLSLGMGTLWFQNSGFEMFRTAEIQKSLVYGVLAFLLVGFGEEALFRGYIQKRLMLSFGNRWALLISSLIFMAAHLLTYGKLMDFIDVALGGVILGYLYILTDSLYLPAAYHFIYDFIQVNIVKLQDYEHYKGAVLYLFENSGDVVIRGVNYGNIIEVSFIIVELVVLAFLYIFRYKIEGLSAEKAE